MSFIILNSLLFCEFLLASNGHYGGNINLQPKQLINAENMGQIFRGNRSSNNFKLLITDGDFILVGARNAVYNLSMQSLTVKNILEWPSTPTDVEMCLKKSKSEEDCNNYIRVLVKQNDGKIMVCGTNAFSPLCRQYAISEDSTYQVKREFNGNAISPYDPNHNSTSVYIAETDELYTGSVSDFTGTDSLIYRKPLDGRGTTTNEMRTLRNDLKCLNDPNFVSSFADDTSVYFWFRETAAEYTDHGRQIYGRVARVCKGDQGSSNAAKKSQQREFGTWTTFLKARLNCSMPGDIPFYFNELQATTQIISGLYGPDAEPSSIVYGVFSTPYTGMQASAVCAYRLQDVQRIFNKGAFKHQPDSKSLWQPISKSHKRIGNCDLNPKTVSDDMTNFVQKNSLMHEAVPNFFGEPIFVDTNLKSQMTQIAVHKAKTVDGAVFDVLFVGTSDGRVLKLVNCRQNSRSDVVSTVLIDSLRLFPNRAAVQNLLIYDRKSENDQSKLIVISRDEVKTAPLHFCANKTNCGACVRLRDPYCAWDADNANCIAVTNGQWPKDRNLIQNVLTGQAQNCPSGDLDIEFYNINELYAPSTSNDFSQTPGVYSAESMALAVVLTITLTSVLGFFVGYRLASSSSSNWRQNSTNQNRERIGGGVNKGDQSPACSSSADDDYEAPPSYKSNAPSSDFYESAMSALRRPLTTTSGAADKFTFDVVGNSPNDRLTIFDSCKEESVKLDNFISTCEKNFLPPPPPPIGSTLPRDYKVKKVYL